MLLRPLKNKIYQNMYLNSFLNGETILNYPPREIFIEPTNYCNLRCVMCPQHNGLKREKGYMKIGLYKKIIGEIKRFQLRRLNLFMSGEPFLHPQIIELVRIAKKENIPVRIHTNATLLNENLAKEILSCGLDMISFSFDGETKERYEAMRINADYEDVLAKIKYFLSEKKMLGNKLPYTQIQVIKDYDPEIKQPKVNDAFKKIFKGLPVDKFDAICFLSFGDFLDDSQYRYFNGKFYEPCRQLWSRFAIGWDGQAIACCVDSNGENIIGNVRNESVFKIWNGKKMTGLREMMVKRKYTEISPCKKCNLIWSEKNYLDLKKKKNILLKSAENLLWRLFQYADKKKG